MRTALADHLLLTRRTLAAEPIVGRTSVTDGNEDLNAWMVSQGYATAYQRYSRDHVGTETTARALRRGLWAGTFDPPSDWRRAERAGGNETRPEMEKPPAAAPAPVQAACAIKGNISRKGNKIYHLLGTRDYDRTGIDTSSGERMFCSEDEAKAAGWRAARG